MSTAAQLGPAYADFVRYNRYDARVVARHPDIERPMVQECRGPGEPVYSISGFCDARHDLFVCRGARKLVQWPRLAGVGILFEDAPVDDDLAQKIRRMCGAMDFVGVFEAEFIGGPADRRLIDFNPRFFGQMGFDIVRGLPSPLLVYLAAIGDDARLEPKPARARLAIGRSDALRQQDGAGVDPRGRAPGRPGTLRISRLPALFYRPLRPGGRRRRRPEGQAPWNSGQCAASGARSPPSAGDAPLRAPSRLTRAIHVCELSPCSLVCGECRP